MNWPILLKIIPGHTVLYRATRGVIGQRFPGLPPMLLLDHVGRNSGTHRTTPLAYLTDGDDIVVIASKGGHPKDPGWLKNLQVDPETTVQIGGERREVRARVATADERARLWPRAVAAYGGFQGYQDRTGREIPVVILERR
jgi:deazaflavin-dependent oxidoreductase (nitroreductase family)